MCVCVRACVYVQVYDMTHMSVIIFTIATTIINLTIYLLYLYNFLMGKEHFPSLTF